MAITTKGTLKTAFTGWLARTDLTTTVKDEIIVLAEKDIGRVLKKKVIREALTLDAGAAFKTLPATVGILRSIRFNTTTRQYPLKGTTAEALAHLRRVGSAAPVYAAVVDGVILFDIKPDTAYDMEIIYYEALVPLAADGDTNTTLTASPDIYLFACLKEAELYLEHDERNPVWTAKYDKAVAAENQKREDEELMLAPQTPSLPIVLG